MVWPTFLLTLRPEEVSIDPSFFLLGDFASSTCCAAQAKAGGQIARHWSLEIRSRAYRLGAIP